MLDRRAFVSKTEIQTQDAVQDVSTHHEAAAVSVGKAECNAQRPCAEVAWAAHLLWDERHPSEV